MAIANDPVQALKEAAIKTNPHLNEANEYFNAGLYSSAISLYKQLIKEIETAKDPLLKSDDIANQALVMHSKLFLAEAYLATNQKGEAIDLLQKTLNQPEPTSLDLQPLYANSLYLLALSHKKANQREAAKQAFESYLRCQPESLLSFQQEARFEIGVLYFLNGDLKAAKAQFDSFQKENPSSRLRTLSQIYMARIDIKSGNFIKAETTLEALSKEPPFTDALQYELSYFLGEARFHLRDFAQAAKNFQASLPNELPKACGWYPDTLYFLGLCHLNLADHSDLDSETQSLYFSKAGDFFEKLLATQPEERVYLAIGQYHLSRAKRMNDPSAYPLAEAILSNTNLFQSKQSKTDALLLLAEAAPTYFLRNKHYKQLMQEGNKESSIFAKGCYLSALNDFEEGSRLLKLDQRDLGSQTLKQSILSFGKAFPLLEKQDSFLAGASLKYQALAYGELGTRLDDISAFNTLDEIIQTRQELLNSLEHPEEIYYLHGFFALRLLPDETNKPYATIAQNSLEMAGTALNCPFGDKALKLLADWHYRSGDFHAAEKTYLILIERFPTSTLIPEAYLWAAYSADQLKKCPNVALERRRHVYEDFSGSSSAAEAFFTSYSYRDYLQGKKEAIRHLHHFIKHDRETLFHMQANFLVGLNFKRNRKTTDGKWISKKNLTEAIDAFQRVETLFHSLSKKKLIPQDRLNYYTAICNRAILERATTNLAIAEESQGSKQEIYLEYAEDVFSALIAQLKPSSSSPEVKTLQEEPPFTLYQECAFGLAQTYIKRQNDSAAKLQLSNILDYCQAHHITNGYYLSRANYELGGIDRREAHDEMALKHFEEAEVAARGNLLGTDEKLDLWIQQSHCYRDLKQFDRALLLLSKVANDDAISSLRLKAMYLRATIYELQNRPELARKQLESVARKGGNFALKAKQKLENDYGY